MIHIERVTKVYRRAQADETIPLRDFSLHIEPGESVVLKGPSGSGKSTVLNMIAGLIKPDKGTVETAGKLISRLPEQFAAAFRRENIGMIFQRYHLLEEITVLDNITLPLLPSCIPLKDLHHKAFELMEKLEITDKAASPVSGLSGGEMQRTAIARALINDPQIILADEPTANLDEKLTEEFIKMMKLLRSEGKTIVTATHDPALTNGARVIEMTKGG